MHISGFQNGIQASDEARQQLESVLERLKEDKVHQDEEINSSKTSQDSKQATKKRKPAAKRKQKKNESLETSQALSICPSGSLDREMADRESVSKPLTGKRKRKRNGGEDSESPQFSLSHSSGMVHVCFVFWCVFKRLCAVNLLTIVKTKFKFIQM